MWNMSSALRSLLEQMDRLLANGAETPVGRLLERSTDMSVALRACSSGV